VTAPRQGAGPAPSGSQSGLRFSKFHAYLVTRSGAPAAMSKVVDLDSVLQKAKRQGKCHLLLGNGFSIALKPDIFSYGSLFQNADFSEIPHVPKLFEALGTQDFEIAIRHIQDAAKILNVYDPGQLDLMAKMRNDASAIKDALVSAVAKRHPDRPYNISKPQYIACRDIACRAFLRHFDHIFTLNYDVLLYWTLMQDEVDKQPFNADDGFRHPEQDPSLPYVSWQQANSATVNYLHGALHLFDQGTEIVKYTWSKTDIAIVEQIRQALREDKFPLFVAEGTSESKIDRILHSAYLHKALRSFEGCCLSPKNSIVIFGHSLADNDAHVLRCIAHGGVSDLFVSLYGDPNSAQNKSVVENAERLAALRKKRRRKSALTVTFYDAASARVWG
jgi:hypothetical protein